MKLIFFLFNLLESREELISTPKFIKETENLKKFGLTDKWMDLTTNSQKIKQITRNSSRSPISNKKSLSINRGSRIKTEKIEEDEKIIIKEIIPFMELKKFKTLDFDSKFETSFIKKFEEYKSFLYNINLSNNMIVKFPSINCVYYKVFIGLGNNSNLIRNAFKNRFKLD